MTISATASGTGNVMDGATDGMVDTLRRAKEMTAGELYAEISKDQAVLAAANRVFATTNKNNEGVKNF
jgi:hypothetical protein